MISILRSADDVKENSAQLRVERISFSTCFLLGLEAECLLFIPFVYPFSDPFVYPFHILS